MASAIKAEFFYSHCSHRVSATTQRDYIQSDTLFVMISVDQVLFLTPSLFQAYSAFKYWKHIPKAGRAFNISAIACNVIILPPFFFGISDTGLGGLLLVFILSIFWFWIISVAIGNLAVMIMLRLKKVPSSYSYLVSWILLSLLIAYVGLTIVSIFLPSDFLLQL